ncbi:bifunctional 5,10-methylene-tetrahydrofolate dehydrogenase/5,10-methylene-tetrahydrofolate cyclohydrolase [Patescibacteria group bacterium]|nr:bifunctional 5,10-methylene-tetrahydrofolate dehydrogenase/5,10-methylene-tetrahydrofolate cyclohydrolase [Patescibacteria group bacterium]MBU1123235.1 bifunctional 5,10-methylene-tetrahydrofolate dehydrogenase/5,10-methylene-tetrahydrofolate cyclohydrolase [Patescibacteria group bacterium]MBU1910959.1 bifunctional 5,10-methylene-tetrahydrofolate dehydrogenase/5,10-methylene-tetrahydrofolate cyclohydrolase [Patescibacteria group bacterium]
MPATLLSGREAAGALLEGLKSKVKELDPKLVIVQVGEDPASSSYIKQKFKSCEKVGMRSEHMHLPPDTSLDDLMNVIDKLNTDADVSGFIVQLPLPKQLEDKVPEIIRAIDPKKDVDGFGAYNLGKTFLSTEFEHLPPATPSGIIAMLEHYKIQIEGKHAVIVGRSNIVGKPLSIMLLNRNATVTVCHSRTKDLASLTRLGDILICAVGKAKMITRDMVKEGAIVIDVGMNKTEYGLVGDVDFEEVKEIASAITPVPGGVGPMTVASLIRNCVRAKERQTN